MICRSKRYRFLVGIEYESPYDNQGYFDIDRTVTITELAEEILGFMRNGHHYPIFPSSANPTILFAWDLSDPENGDCYHELVEIIKLLKKQNGVKIV